MLIWKKDKWVRFSEVFGDGGELNNINGKDWNILARHYYDKEIASHHFHLG